MYKAVLLKKVLLVEEAEDRFPVYTLTFALPEDAPEALGVRIDVGDVIKVKVPARAATGGGPKSYSMSAARPADREFDLTYKLYPGGVCSGYLDSIQIGETMECFGRGSKERVAGSHVGIIAYGVGITEAFPVTAAELSKPDAKAVTLLWASKRYADKFWLNSIEELEATYPDRFTFKTILSREEREGSLRGRINKDTLQSVFLDEWGTDTDKEDVRWLSVGTKPMMADCYSHLRELGFDASKDGGKNALFQKA